MLVDRKFSNYNRLILLALVEYQPWRDRKCLFNPSHKDFVVYYSFEQQLINNFQLGSLCDGNF